VTKSVILFWNHRYKILCETQFQNAYINLGTLNFVSLTFWIPSDHYPFKMLQRQEPPFPTHTMY